MSTEALEKLHADLEAQVAAGQAPGLVAAVVRAEKPRTRAARSAGVVAEGAGAEGAGAEGAGAEGAEAGLGKGAVGVDADDELPQLRGAVVGGGEAGWHGFQEDVFCVGTLGLDSAVPVQRDSIFRIASLAKPIVAFAALQMIKEGIFGLDEPVDRLLPELADRQVLRSLESPVTDTVPAERPILVVDLLRFTSGLGLVMAMPDTYPIQAALDRAIGAPGPPQPAKTKTPDEYLAALGNLPLLHQPGAAWAYNTSSDLLGILMARATGSTLQKVLQERIFDRLGMRDTGFSVPGASIKRLTASYTPNGDGLDLFDPSEGSQWSSPPRLESGAGGLVSTVDDLLAFTRLMLGRGVFQGERLLSDELFTAMTTDQLSAAQKSRTIWVPGFFDTHGWGFGLAVRTVAGDGESAGAYAWSGGLGTSWGCDPVVGSAGILLTQRAMTSPAPEALTAQFWDGVHAACS
ncbi:serine hydrolase domain-containing protein [Kineosporia babensis]|uniref:Beta-lactamase family protein n=1 Tax=Kineosporia babensis TaxID=499548 RepID=A0A9X1NIE0_9ACTN|nr:serine hydrolase domain-containing protein [Kineosporia babensis]MCD5313668.1 beta-lactamase family protein [Kineosporia babensis]